MSSGYGLEKKRALVKREKSKTNIQVDVNLSVFGCDNKYENIRYDYFYDLAKRSLVTNFGKVNFDSNGNVKKIEGVGNAVANEEFQYEKDLLKSLAFKGYAISNEYDSFKRVKEVSVNDELLFNHKYRGSSLDISHIDYSGLNVDFSFSTEKLDPIYGQLESVKPFFDDIRYEDSTSIFSINSSYLGDVTEIKGKLTNRIHEKVVQKNNDLIISYKDNFYDDSKKVKSISYFVKGVGSWDTEKDRSIRASQFNRNKKGHVDKILNLNIKWDLINPTQFTRADGSVVENNFNALGEFRSSCKVSNTGDDEECFVRITDNDFLIGGSSVHYIKINNDVKGIVIKNENGDVSYYYALTDSLGSLVGVLDKNLEPIFIRKYSKFGSFETIILNEEIGRILDHQITLAFAGLHKNPYLEYTDNEAQVLHSKTRLYLPQIREWASLDPIIYLNPKALLMMEGRISPFRYAKGEPLNFVDSSGHIALPVMAIGTALGGGIGAISGGIVAMATNSILYSGIMVGMTTGAFIGSGASLVAGLTGTGAIAAQGAIGSIFGFTGNLVGQVGFTGRVDIVQSFVAGIGGGVTTTFSAALGYSFNAFAKDVGIGMSYMSTDIGLSLAADRYSEVKIYRETNGYTRENGYAEPAPGMADM
ncbi:RHS repeat-associated core domain protein [Bacteriovorax sp. BSW11_IV]|uniref:RHS repeat domain-containing protein n=1 Tax=Bacteriovorax sp. BSW11_IV TaxID=1353529 RepID=UPI000389F00E|nr:RHS repeat-associated core domain protein [Bacteriovorax sp. BSW11_IV]EQC45082.1 RHS repeat-associated core domain protein [Bacteriovorax sp. BSW11_IV]